MKRSLLFLALITFFGSGFIQAQSGMTDEERKRAVKHMSDTQDDLFKTIKGLSDEQLNFRVVEDSGTVAECIRHMTISENTIWAGFVEAPLATDPDPSRRSEVTMTDDQILGIIESRAQGVRTSAPFEPENKPEPLDQVLKEFKQMRADHIKFTKKTKEDLRNRYGTLPFGTIDAYQALLFMSGHTRRHIDQIKEVMASANFPEK